MIKLNSKAISKITRFSGIVTARCEYASGLVRIEITSTELHEGKINREWFDEGDLEPND